MLALTLLSHFPFFFQRMGVKKHCIVICHFEIKQNIARNVLLLYSASKSPKDGSEADERTQLLIFTVCAYVASWPSFFSYSCVIFFPSFPNTSNLCVLYWEQKETTYHRCKSFVLHADPSVRKCVTTMSDKKNKLAEVTLIAFQLSCISFFWYLFVMSTYKYKRQHDHHRTKKVSVGGRRPSCHWWCPPPNLPPCPFSICRRCPPRPISANCLRPSQSSIITATPCLASPRTTWQGSAGIIITIVSNFQPRDLRQQTLLPKRYWLLLQNLSWVKICNSDQEHQLPNMLFLKNYFQHHKMS